MEPEIVISRTYSEGKIVTKEESESLPGIHPHIYPEGVKVGSVTCGGRITVNLGNYESVQIYVEVSLPAAVEEIAEAYQTAKRFVEIKLSEQKSHIDTYKKAMK